MANQYFDAFRFQSNPALMQQMTFKTPGLTSPTKKEEPGSVFTPVAYGAGSEPDYAQNLLFGGLGKNLLS